jgi:hypothetical protein
MTLDFHVKDDIRAPAPAVHLLVDDHWKLVQASEGLTLRLFDRFRDYYGEGEVAAAEMENFIDELNRLAQAVSISVRLRKVVGELVSLAADAKLQKKPIIALPD